MGGNGSPVKRYILKKKKSPSMLFQKRLLTCQGNLDSLSLALLGWALFLHLNLTKRIKSDVRNLSRAAHPL